MANIEVFLDAVSLPDGFNWEMGFSDGLRTSQVFVCVLSREAQKSFSGLTKDSNCDNVLLEYYLALEYEDRGIISLIYPLFLGDKRGEIMGGLFYVCEYIFNYFYLFFLPVFFFLQIILPVIVRLSAPVLLLLLYDKKCAITWIDKDWVNQNGRTGQ